MHAVKFVVLRPHTAAHGQLVLLGLAPTTHRDLAAAHISTHSPVSAGFVSFGPEGVRTYGSSDSLCLTPAPGDAALIDALMRATHRTSTVL